MLNERMSVIADRVRARLTATGQTAQSVSLAIGADRSFVRKILDGSIPRADNLDRLAGVLGCSIQYLLGHDDNPTPLAVADDGLWTRYMVQAGVWREIEEPTDAGHDPRWGRSPISADPRWPIECQWAERVSGNSMDKIVADGGFIHVVSYVEAGSPVRDKMVVVVERRRSGLVERTVKRLVELDGQPVLVGESTDPKWNAPVDLGCIDPDHEEVEIVGIVIGTYSPTLF